ncbi:MAG: hypothetical protein NTY68_04185 [Candidatus Micrarchaeota archaeon]|nr:hypothetical protein [Candidatus Micrarchaeota archaeon]
MIRRSIVISIRNAPQARKENSDLEEFSQMLNMMSRRDTHGTRNVDGRYVMESESMEQYINRLEKEAEETFTVLRQLAKSIDKKYARREIKIK